MAKPRRPRDTNQLAKLIVELSTGEAQDAQETPKARAGRLGGIKGGKARADALSPSRRKQIAKKAATVRWKSR
jgi:hypothetical protein